MKGVYMKNGEVTEVIYGNGLVELVPETVEPGDPMKPVDAPFYFFAKKERAKQSVMRNIAICAATVAPVIAVSVLADVVKNDMLFCGLCWASIAWVGFVIFANCRRR